MRLISVWDITRKSSVCCIGQIFRVVGRVFIRQTQPLTRCQPNKQNYLKWIPQTQMNNSEIQQAKSLKKCCIFWLLESEEEDLCRVPVFEGITKAQSTLNWRSMKVAPFIAECQIQNSNWWVSFTFNNSSLSPFITTEQVLTRDRCLSFFFGFIFNECIALNLKTCVYYRSTRCCEKVVACLLWRIQFDDQEAFEYFWFLHNPQIYPLILLQLLLREHFE